ncbi:MAG: AAA family ATPase, partial [Proteobacteria bacterium]|nr:AAA family ATPase [Pseudomonadota bacterium]
MKIKPLPSKLLCTKCNLKLLNFSTTNELAVLSEPIGQDRAMSAIELGIHIRQSGYNLYLLGPKGTGKYNLINSVLKLEAVNQPTPNDWCYIHNFSDPQKPLALELPPGMGPELQKDMNSLIEDLRTEIPAILDSVEFRSQIQKLEDGIKNREEDEFKKIEDKAQQNGLAIVTTPKGFLVTPLRDGKPMTNKEMEQLPDAERTQKQQKINAIRDQLTQMLEQLPRWHKEKHDKQKVLQKEFTSIVVNRLVEQMQQKYQQQNRIIQFLNIVSDDIMENSQAFYSNDRKIQTELSFIKYKVNVLVSHAPNSGAPVIYEDHPSHVNLIGRSEYMAELGAFTTNFTLIRAGALHQANGGFLILDAQQVLTQPYAWESLKRMLYGEKITIESLGQAMGFPSTVSLEPEPIPLRVKVILLGERSLYYLLSENDVYFPDLFKIAADFSNHIARTPENLILFARLLATVVEKQQLLPLNRHAVAKMIDHSCRLSGDSRRLLIFLRTLQDLLCEANYWADQEGHVVIKATDIQKAIDQQILRSNRLQIRIQEDYRRGLLLVDTKGKKIGHVNGLSVLQIGNYAFGSPSRITAAVR